MGMLKTLVLPEGPWEMLKTSALQEGPWEMLKTWGFARGTLGDAENLRLCKRGPGRC